MRKDRKTTRYEIRAGRLHVNGERQAVAARTVAAAAALYPSELGELAQTAPSESICIPEELARLILHMEARIAVQELREAFLTAA